MSNLRSTINELAETFASEIVKAIRGASLQDILSETTPGMVGRSPRPATGGKAAAPQSLAKRRGGKRVRRSGDEIWKTAASILELLKGHKAGFRAEEIRAQLSMPKNELAKPIAELLAKKKITKKGQKRSTTYFAR